VRSEPRDPLVSVVIPTFNSGDFAAASIGSVLTQSYRRIEVLVIDDGSVDGTPQNVLEMGDGRVKLEEISHRGVAAARNTGVAKARGEFVAFLDHDDLWYPAKLDRQVAWLQEEPALCLVGCFMDLITGSDQVVGKTGQELDRRGQEQVAIGRLMPFPMSSVLVRRDALDEVGGFDEELSTSETGGVDDLDLISRLAAIGQLQCVPEVLGCYRHHTASFTASNFKLQRLGTRFVQERCAARMQGRQLTWESFASDYRPSLNARREDAAAAAYYAAGMYAIQRRWGRATLGAARSMLLAPGYTVTRLRVNRPWKTRRVDPS
jgi:glycosyltransferase involved in cell wall biosynthesis